jgi:lysophospholipase L1-like esterase
MSTYIAAGAAAILALGACARKEPSTNVVDASPATPSPVASVDPPSVSSGASVAPLASTAPEPRKYKVVLHTGDSTVGGNHALTGALKKRFTAEGSRFLSDTVESASIVSVANDTHLKELVTKHNPDLVIINLGTNEVFVPAPQALAGRIDAIVKRIGPRACIWIGPPTWKPDTGIVNVIREHAAPCKFFDSSNLKLDRIVDGIHPSNEGGEQWAAAFWAFFRPT